MKVKIVYFAYLIPNKWETIIREQLDSLKNLELYNEAINIYMSVISDNEQLEKLKEILKNDYNKVQIYNVYTDNYYEYPGIQALYKIAEDEDDIVLLYLHSKGMTSNQHETRQYLFKYTIDNYKQYISEFNNNKNLDVAGAIPHKHGFVYFNFFWARSSYIRNYCSRPEISENRYIWEVWVGSEFSRKKQIITYSPIIKYDQVTNTDEVWNIHNRMIKDEYKEPKLENKENKESILENKEKIILEEGQETVNYTVKDTVKYSVKEIKEIKPIIINKPKKIINGVVDNKPIKLTKPIKTEPIKTEPIKTEPITEPINNKLKPLKIDPSKGYQIQKPIKITKSNVIKTESISKTEQTKEQTKEQNLDQNKEQNLDQNQNQNLNQTKEEINYINPYTIFEKLKNKNHIVVELGAGVGLNTYMIRENNKENITRLESNIRNYCHKNIKLCKKQLVQVKDKLSECITFKELIYYEIHKYFQNINLIVCDMDGNEEDILEDILHYAFHSKVKILLKLNTEKWKNKDISRFNYLFEFYNYDKNLLKLNEWIYLEGKTDPSLQLFKKNMSIVVIGFNQYTYITKMIKQLEPYSNDIIIIDNNSDYKPLINYYENEYKYTLLKMDKNYGHKVYEETFIVNMLGNNYIITDPDLEFNKKLPANCIQEMVQISKEYKAGRVGFALLIDTDDIRPELSYAGMPLKQWEGRFWMNKIKHPKLDLYNAPIDTTFCLLNTVNNIHGLSIRIGGDYICKHKPWHYNYYLELLDDEYDYYLKNNKSTNFWVDKSKEKSINKLEDKLEEKLINKPITKPINKLEENVISGTGSFFVNKNDNEVFTRIPITESLPNSDDEVENIDDWIINKVKNDKSVAINIGSIDVTSFVEKFKCILNVSTNISCVNKNVINYDNKIVSIKKNKDDMTLKEFIYKQELLIPIKFINISYDGEEENIIEDLLHFY